MKSEAEYVEAIEFLYRHPEERNRLGTAAREYVTTNLGIDNTYQRYQQVYADLLKHEKRPHVWGRDNFYTDGDVENYPDTVNSSLTPAEILIESLGESEGAVFRISIKSTVLEDVLQAEAQIKESRYVLAKNGIVRFRNLYPEDPFLNLWAGLCCEKLGDPGAAATCYSKAIKQGLTQWRVVWYLARALESMGETEKASNLMHQLNRTVPEFNRAIAFSEITDSGQSFATPLQHVPGA